MEAAIAAVSIVVAAATAAMAFSQAKRIVQQSSVSSHNLPRYEELRQFEPRSEGPYTRNSVDVRSRQFADSVNAPRATHSDGNESGAVFQGDQLLNIGRQIMSLANSNYTIDATVIFEDTSQQGSNRFIYKPAKIKFDTGSDVDMVSRDYLLRARFPMNELIPIPVEDQTVVHGINNTTFIPKFEIELTWSRLGDARTNTGCFMVVDDAPFDLLLKSRRFLDYLRLSSLHLFRPRKRGGIIEQERQEEQRRIEAAEALEEEEYRQEMARRSLERRRVGSIITAADAPNDNGVD